MPTGDGETLAVETPSPAPPPPTASSSPSSTRHRRHCTFSSSSSLSTVSSAASSPSPSPRGRGTTTTSTTTSVPFSWEHHPGIPKTTRLLPAGAVTPSSSEPTPLPLPPPLRAPTTSSSRPRHHHHAHVRRRRGSSKKPPAADASADPFATALAECTRERGDDAGLMDALFPSRAPPASSLAAPTSRRWSSIASSAGGVVGLLDLYGCKSAMAGGVAEGAFVVRRPVAVVRAGPGRAGRR